MATVIAVPGGLVGAAAAVAARLYGATATGDPRMDAYRWPIALAVVREFGINASVPIARALTVIPLNENSFGQVGDKTASVGPSVTPWQLSRALAKDLGIWRPAASGLDAQGERDAYVADAASWSTWRQADAAAKAFNRKVTDAGGDVADAIRRWNGSGPAAEKYQVAALDKAGKLWGGLA